LARHSVGAVSHPAPDSGRCSGSSAPAGPMRASRSRARATHSTS
jgi:hypothetical protein